MHKIKILVFFKKIFSRIGKTLDEYRNEKRGLKGIDLEMSNETVLK